MNINQKPENKEKKLILCDFKVMTISFRFGLGVDG